MLHCALCIHPVIVQFSARHTRACFISSTLHVYMCHSSSSPRRPLVQPDTHAITLHVLAPRRVQLRLHNNPVRPAVFTRGQPGRREIRFRRARARAASQSDVSGSYCKSWPCSPCWTRRGFAFCRASLLGHLFAFHYVAGLGRRLRFPSGFWQRLLAPAQSPGEIILIAGSPPRLVVVLSTLGRSTTPRLETLLHSRDVARAAPSPDSLATPHPSFRQRRPRDPRPPRESCCELGIRSRAVDPSQNGGRCGRSNERSSHPTTIVRFVTI